jgi:5-hydroxyisourate hydrolase
MSQVTTHVLDAALGRPAANIPVRLETSDGTLLDASATDHDGRIGDLGPAALEPGDYRLIFETRSYFAETHFRDSENPSFYPSITIDFAVTDDTHYHVPVLLSPFAYSTYRGS